MGFTDDVFDTRQVMESLLFFHTIHTSYRAHTTSSPVGMESIYYILLIPSFSVFIVFFLRIKATWVVADLLKYSHVNFLKTNSWNMRFGITDICNIK
jgi:hypothetical protein